ncbi:MAG: GGDEF domain-containing protein [Spirochaetes bacterium]|nr:GGDEF domain-containing protein [Spirochaetota bacterium]
MFPNENDGKIFKFAAVVIFIISAFLFVKYAVESNIYRKQVYLLYTDIVHGKDLVADILPPPAYIIESYLAAYEMRENINNPAKSDQIAQYIRDRLMRDYLNSYDYWKKNSIYIESDEVMKTELLDKSLVSAEKFYKTLNEEYIPAVKRRDLNKANMIMADKLQPYYADHRNHIDNLIKMASERNGYKTVYLASMRDKVRTTHNKIIITGSIAFIIIILFLTYRFVFFFRANAVLKEKNKRLHELSLVDNLTGLYNRHYFQFRINEYIDSVKESFVSGCSKLGFFMIDIDFFKQINDVEGHLFGDLVLKHFGERLKSAIREEDIPVRWGGEEFLLLVPRTDEARSCDIAMRILEKINSKPFIIGEKEIDLSCSIGYCLYPFDSNSSSAAGWREAVKAADSALYIAKNKGRNRSVGVFLNSSIDNGCDIKSVLSDFNKSAEEGKIILKELS